MIASADLAIEQKRLTELYRDVTDCIPVLLGDNEGLPLGEIYAPLLIEEDLDAMKRTRHQNKPSGSKTLKSVRNVFYVRDHHAGEKLSTRILIKGEAGSGKSVFCLKLVECWCHLKQSVKQEHVCEKHSKLIRQLEMDSELPELLNKLRFDSWPCRLPEIPCTACEMKQCLSQFDLLYFVPLRDATEGKTSVLDLLCDAVCKKRQKVIDRTKVLLDSDNIRCLIVLDGVDEWQNPPGFTGLPNSDGLSDNCFLLWTMRPWKLVHLQLKPKHDDHIVTVSGLSPYSVAQVIENILNSFYGLNGKELKSKFLAYCKKVKDRTLEGIMRMPMMLVAACHLWHREETIGSNKSLDSKQSFSKTHLYLSLLDLMIQNAAKKQNEQGNMEQNLPPSLLKDSKNNPSTRPDMPMILKTYHHVSRFIDMLLPFCELAFTDLMSADTKLIFNKGQLEKQLGKSHVDLAHRLGLISQAKVRSDIGRPQNVSVSFYHKSVQELLAAMYMTCVNQDTVTMFCKYCSTLGKVMETANITMFVVGLDPSWGCRICEHITNIVNSDTVITEYRRTLDDRYWDRVQQLYGFQCEWYRELTHSQNVTGDTSPPPSLHVTDICLIGRSASDTLRLTEELMSANLNSIVSVRLWSVRHPLHRVALLLPQCPNLSALYIGFMHNKENDDLLVSVAPRLTQLTTVRYRGSGLWSNTADHRAVVAAVMTLTQLVRVRLEGVCLGDGGFITADVSDDDGSVTSLCDDGVETTDAMTRLRTVVLYDVHMTAVGWDRSVSNLLALPQSVCVVLDDTNIDEETVRRIQASNCITITRDDGRRDWIGRYVRLQFKTVPSQTRYQYSDV